MSHSKLAEKFPSRVSLKRWNALFGLALGALTLAATSTVAAAQDQKGVQNSAPGSIIVLRNVPHGSALERQFEAEPMRVETGPERIILSSLTHGLTPLTDAQQGAVFGSTLSPVLGQLSLADGGFSHIETALSAGTSQQRGGGGSGAGRIVADALSNLPSVGAIIRSAGTGQ